MRSLYINFVLVALIVALGTTLSYTVRMNRMLAEESAALRRILTAGSILNYGTVVAIDPLTRMLRYKIINPYDQNGSMIESEVHIHENAIIGKQSLIRGASGAYVGLSDFEAIPLFAVLPGDRIAISSSRANDSSRSESMYVVVGNPL